MLSSNMLYTDNSWENMCHYYFYMIKFLTVALLKFLQDKISQSPITVFFLFIECFLYGFVLLVFVCD